MRWALEAGHAARLGLARGFIMAFPTGGTKVHRTRSPFTDDVARALADEGNLQLLAQSDPHDRGVRDIWETIVVTGRRAGEVIGLRLDCVGRCNGLPLLWHDQTKVGSLDEAIRNHPRALDPRGPTCGSRAGTTAWRARNPAHSPCTT